MTDPIGVVVSPRTMKPVPPAKDGTGSPAGSADGATERRLSLDHYGPVEEDRALTQLEADLAVTPDPYDVDGQHEIRCSLYIPPDAFDESKPVVSHELLALMGLMAVGAAMLVIGGVIAVAVFT